MLLIPNLRQTATRGILWLKTKVTNPGVSKRKYGLYLFRWQLSTPLLAPVCALLSDHGFWVSAAVANLIGGLLFFWIDRWIFKRKEP